MTAARTVLKILFFPLWWLLRGLYLRAALVGIDSPAEDACVTCNPPGQVNVTVTFSTPLPVAGYTYSSGLYFQDGGGALTPAPAPTLAAISLTGGSMSVSFPFDCTTLAAGAGGCKDLVIMIVRTGPSPSTRKRIVALQTVKLCRNCPP